MSSTTWLDKLRASLDISPDKVKYNPENKCYYYNEAIGYSLLASMDYTSETLVISSTFDGSNVYTIRSNAIAGLEHTKIIKIEDGITKIQGKAFRDIDDVLFVYIPDSVSVINAYGFNSIDCNNYLVEADSKPSEWDSYWNGSNSSLNVHYSIDQNINYKDGFIYTANPSHATLIKYIGSSTTVKIPRTIDGVTVREIKADFFSGSGTRYFYIPTTVNKIESKAFVNTSSSTFYFYCEIDAQPSTWASDFYYNSYYGSTSNYRTLYWSRELDY